MQRLHVLLSCAFVCFACDPQGDDPEALALADDIDELDEPLRAAPPADEDSAPPDADVPLGADVKPQQTGPCKTQSQETKATSLTNGCKGKSGPNSLPEWTIGLEDIGTASALSECSSSGNSLTNGKARCTSVCEQNNKVWNKVIDGGICLINTDVTVSPVQWQTAPVSTCPAGLGKYTASVETEAQCGCTCSP
jgi:hypothetical protein